MQPLFTSFNAILNLFCFYFIILFVCCIIINIIIIIIITIVWWIKIFIIIHEKYQPVIRKSLSCNPRTAMFLKVVIKI